MTQTPKRPRDSNQLAKMILDLATGDAAEPIVKTVSPLGRAAGGKAGGAARAKALSPEKRKEIAEKAAQARWRK